MNNPFRTNGKANAFRLITEDEKKEKANSIECFRGVQFVSLIAATFAGGSGLYAELSMNKIQSIPLGIASLIAFIVTMLARYNQGSHGNRNFT